jgi:hypothetical protein
MEIYSDRDDPKRRPWVSATIDHGADTVGSRPMHASPESGTRHPVNPDEFHAFIHS